MTDHIAPPIMIAGEHSPRKDRARRRWSWRVSGSLHAVAIGLIVFDAFMPILPELSPPRGVRKNVLLVSGIDQSEPAEPLTVELALDDRSWLRREAEEVASTQVDLDDPLWEDILREPERHARAEAERAAGADSFLSLEVQRRLAEADRRSHEENIAQLQALGEKLDRVSSSEGVDEVSGTLARMLGAGERAVQPKAKAPAGPFDFSSAQLHDVRRDETPDGKVRYVAIMLDAAGRTEENELGEEEGRRAFETFQLIKSNPLLERVYRGIVLSLMDKLSEERGEK